MNVGFEEAFQPYNNQSDWILTIYFELGYLGGDVTPSSSSSGLGGVPRVKETG